MARINSYTRDKSITTEDTLIGSSYEGTNQQGPIYQTQSYKVGDLAKYLNLVFTVDEVNYNLNDMILRIDALEDTVGNLQDVSTYVSDNYTISLDTNGHLEGLLRLGDLSTTPLTFTVDTFNIFDSNEGLSVNIFDNINGELKIKKEYLQLDSIVIPPAQYTTVIYADNVNGDNQSLSASGKSYYAFFEGTEKLTESNFDPPYTGLQWLQITGDPGESFTRITISQNVYVISYNEQNQENTTVNFTTEIWNVPQSEATYLWYVDDVPQTPSPTTTSTFTLPQGLEPAFGEQVTVKVELYRLGILVEHDTTYVAAIKDGTDAIVPLLTNPFSSPPADSDGDVVDPTFAKCVGNFLVWVGGTEVTSLCTYSVIEEVGVDVSIVSNTGYYYTNSMSEDEAYAVFQVTIPAAVAKQPNDVTRTARYSLTKNKAGEQGVIGEPGAPGKNVHLNITPRTVFYDKYGVLIYNNPVVLTAKASGYTQPEFAWYRDDVSLHLLPGSGVTSEWTSIDEYTIPASLIDDTPNSTDVWRVEARENAADTEVSVDTNSLSIGQEGSDGIIVSMSNETASLTTPASGDTNYANTNNSIKVYRGSQILTFVENANDLGPDKYTVSVTGSHITPGIISGNNTTEFLITNASDMGAEDTDASIDFEITVYAVPTNIVINRTQTFSKALQGPTGETIIGPKGERVYSSVVWYSLGTDDETDVPTAIPNPALANDGTYIIYDFNDARLESATQIYDPVTGDPSITPTGSTNTPTGWQEDAPNAIPGTQNGVYWTARYYVEEILNSDGVPTGYGIPTFKPPLSALVFNKVVTFQSEDPSKGQTQIDGGHINTYFITSANYNGPDAGETFADRGTLIDLTKGEIISTNLVLASNSDNSGNKTLFIKGDGEFTGNLTGASGTFGGVTINSSGISSTNFSILSNGVITSTAGTIGGWNIASDAIYTGTKDTTEYSSNGITISSANGGSIHAENFYIDSQGNASFRGDLNGANIGTNIGFTDGYIVLEADSSSLKGTIQFIDATSVNCGSIYSSDTASRRGVSIYSTDRMVFSSGTAAQITLDNTTSNVLPGKVNIYASNGTTIDGGPVQIADVLNLIGLASAGTYSDSGSVVLPGGLEMKWGRTLASSNDTLVAFPQGFVNACLHVSVTSEKSSPSSSGYNYAYSIANGSFRAIAENGSYFRWLAIGY